jgi:hypothetical protein
MEDKDDISSWLTDMGAALSPAAKQELKQKLAAYINELLVHDFSRLVQLLYRIDVDEQRLKKLLQQFPQEDAGVLITALILQRQEEKLKSRLSSRPNEDISEKERW